MLRRAFWIVLVPALALAAPRGHRKPKGTTTKPDTTKPDTAKPDTTATPDAAGSGAGSAAAAAPQTMPATPAPPAGAGSAAPPETAKPEVKDQPSPDTGPDVDSLRQEYLSLRDELFKSRARANAVASQLYSTRITIKLTWTSARYYGISKASVRLDGATVYEDAGGAIANDDGVRFDGYVAPGRHLVTFHIEAAGKDDSTFTSSTESQVVVVAVAQKDLVVAAKAHDNGDIAYAWKRGEHGSYALGIDVGVKSVAQPAAGAKK